MDRTERRNPLLSWLTTSAMLLSAVGLGWAANEAGLHQALYAAGWPVVVGVLAFAALYVFALPFRKHLPRLHVPRWLDRWSGPALGLFGVALSSSTMFSTGSFNFTFFAALLAALLVIEFWRRRRERTQRS